MSAALNCKNEKKMRENVRAASRKPALCCAYAKNKRADQLHDKRTADQCLCFRYIHVDILNAKNLAPPFLSIF